MSREEKEGMQVRKEGMKRWIVEAGYKELTKKIKVNFLLQNAFDTDMK